MFSKITNFVNKARMAKDMMKDETARMEGSVFGKIVGLFIIAILIGSVFVAGLTSLATANTTALTTTQVALIAIVGLILIVGVLWLILEYVGLV
jgi:ABC-type Na+ efflux pump permease subunit